MYRKSPTLLFAKICVYVGVCGEVCMKRRGPHRNSQNPAEKLVWDRDVQTALL